MKYLMIGLGLLAGVCIAAAPRFIDRYAQHGLPSVEWQGPKYRHWHNGVETGR